MEIGPPPSYTKSKFTKFVNENKPKTQVRSYLGIKARICIIIITPFIIGIVIAIVTLISARFSIDSIANSTIKSVNSTCQSVQNKAEDVLNLPYDAQQKLSQQVESGVQTTINGLEKLILLMYVSYLKISATLIELISLKIESYTSHCKSFIKL